MLRGQVAVDGEDGDAELDRNRERKQREQRAEALSAPGVVERAAREALERQIKQEAPNDRVDAEQRDPPDVQVPIVRRKREPERRYDDNDQNRERRREPPVASPEDHGDHEQRRSKQHVEPFLDRQAPRHGVEVDVIGGDEEILDVEEVADKVGSHQVAGH